MREPRSGFSCRSVSLAKPCPRLTLVITIIWVGEWVSNKKPPSVVFPPLASPRVISLQQRARVLFGDRFASIEQPASPHLSNQPLIPPYANAACGSARSHSRY